MNSKLIMGTLMCFSAIVVQDINIFAQSINGEELKSLSKSKLADLRMVMEDNVVVKATNIDVSAEIVKLKKGDTLEVLEELDGWVKINLKGKIGYVKSKYLTSLNTTEKTKYIDNVDKMNIYSEAKSDSKIIGNLYVYDKIEVIEENDSFTKIKFNGEIGYIKSDNKAVVDKVRRYVKNSTILYKKDERGYYKTNNLIKENSLVTVLEGEDDYLKVSTDVGVGYIKKDKVEDRKYVLGDKLNAQSLKEKANDSSNIKTYIPKNAQVSVIGYLGEYVNISYGEYKGYINRKLLSDKRDKVDTECLVNKYKISDKYDLLEIEDKIINIIKSEISKYKKTNKDDDVEIFTKYETEICKLIQRELIQNFGMSKIEKKEVIDAVINCGSYFKVEIKGQLYYVNNEGYDLENDTVDSKVYVQTLPTYDTSVKTRYINKMDVELYSVDGVLKKSKINSNELIFVGYLVKDSVVELVKELDNTYSLIKVNGTHAIIKSSYLSIQKMYTKVESDVKSVQTNKSHKNYVDKQSKKLNIVSKGGNMVNASYEDLAYYSNPNKLKVNNSKAKYQYLKLNEYRNINVFKLNEFLNSIDVPYGKKHIFRDKADVFVEAAKKYNIDPVYLVAHTLLETAYGKSKLAQGIKYNNGQIVYNFFGIGAYDSSPIESGVKTAFRKGWTTIDKTIEGSAEWLSKNYINNVDRCQNTLYKMRFNYAKNGSHQYATDVGWSYKISNLMNKLEYLYEDTKLCFEVPKYKPGTYVYKNNKDDKDKESSKKEDGVKNEIGDECEDMLEQDKDNVETNKPIVPEVPDKPINPNEPIKPIVPDEPIKPIVPDEPIKPIVPDESEVPENQNKPVEPNEPEEDIEEKEDDIESNGPISSEEVEDVGTIENVEN